MPAPYSDNLYSGDLSDDDQDALSPADGYFHASSGEAFPSPAADAPTSSQVPYVPNVLVEDPTLRPEDGAAKAREAEQERLNNSSDPQSPDSHLPQTASQSQPGESTQLQSPVQSPTSARPFHQHRRSVEEDDDTPSSSHQQPPATSSHSTAPHPTSHPRLQQPYNRGGEAPPAYSPSPTSPQGAPYSAGYQTFAPTPVAVATMGVPDEQQRLLPREPESMGGAEGGDAPNGRGLSILRRLRGACTFSNLRKKLRTLLGTLLILSIFLMVLSGFTLQPTHEDHESSPKPPPNTGDPDSDGKPSPTKPPPEHTGLNWQPAPGCLDKPQTFGSFTHGLMRNKDLGISFSQKVKYEEKSPGTHWSPHVFGEVIVAQVPASKASSFVFEMIGNDDDLKVEMNFDKVTQTFEIVTPGSVEWPHTNGSPCLQIRVTLYLPVDSTTHHLFVDVVHLDLLIREGLSVSSSNEVNLTTVIGAVKAPEAKNPLPDVKPYELAARDIHLRTTSGDVSGWYPLYDSLKISTASGNVNVGVGPKPADPKAVKPALLEVDSVSGDLTINEPVDESSSMAFVARDYITHLHTSSGDIKAKLAFTSEAEVNTISGNLELSFLPLVDANAAAQAKQSSLKTVTKSGNTKLDLLHPLWASGVLQEPEGGWGPPAPPAPPAPGADDRPIRSEDPDEDDVGNGPIVIIDPWAPRAAQGDITAQRECGGSPGCTREHVLGNLQSSHRTISGNTKLKYPSAWEGRLSAKTISGSQNIRGEGLEKIHAGGGFSHHVEAVKGSGSSYVELDSMSGNQDVLIGYY